MDGSEEEPPRAEPLEGEAPEQEGCGPLAVERHVKDDGRRLILYSRREQR